ncbi:extracellular solute-binding protein [Pseudorhodoplanes sp.]|uniref:extracellular solute-binding protein n=1 Tax=Pseudorhodoplanes sp. TaxID=1934341 RepID=UPI002D19B143|nr:extracellular solute-binding protein [Pseudorhodoplanes sp.]HWV51958.1 extracellular solute-binding protein [Pseudorhodoplanes sp.]
MSLSRRTLIQAGALALAAPVVTAVETLGPLKSEALASTPNQTWRHGLSLFNELKYPAGFKHFDYVNPKAPRGGLVRQVAIGTFDNFNIVIGGVKGAIAAGIGNIYDRLMASSLDEVSTEYCLLAESVSHPDDFSSCTYRLRAEAKWHDGQPVTADDVIFSFEAFKKHDPQLSAYYRHVVKAEKTGERDITFTFDQAGNRELPQIVGQLNVLPKHWWEGKDSQGRQRDISLTTIEPPLGSGPYKVKAFVAGRSISYERVADYWGKDVNVNVGTNNFDELRYEYFRDSTVALEAFKADNLDWRFENSAKDWATAYDFPAVREKRVILEEFDIRNFGIMQCFAFNTRRDKFKDPRVRRAFNYAFDFEEMNKQIFFGQYRRINSFFEGTELASSGLPEGLELEILQSVKDKVPPEVFKTPFTNPKGGDTAAVRNNLREAMRLFREAGWEVRDQKLTNVKTGEKMQVEVLLSQPTFERIVSFWKPMLERVGVEVSIRVVDPTQYENRQRSWDFDIILASWGQSLSPGNEQRGFWGSKAADQAGSRNFVGIRDEAIDALIERVVFAKNRTELVAATKALDRVLLANHFVVPQWTYGKVRTARWDRFGKPDPLPTYGMAAFPTVWWWDAEKAAKTGSRS